MGYTERAVNPRVEHNKLGSEEGALFLCFEDL